MRNEKIREAVRSDDAGVVEAMLALDPRDAGDARKDDDTRRDGRKYKWPEIGVILTKEFHRGMSQKEKRAGGCSFLLVFPASIIKDLTLFEIKSRIERRTRQPVRHIFVKELEDAAAVYVRIKERNTNFVVDPSHYAIDVGGRTCEPRVFACQGNHPPPAAREIPLAAITKDVTTIRDLDNGRARELKRRRVEMSKNPSTRSEETTDGIANLYWEAMHASVADPATHDSPADEGVQRRAALTSSPGEQDSSSLSRPLDAGALGGRVQQPESDQRLPTTGSLILAGEASSNCAVEVEGPRRDLQTLPAVGGVHERAMIDGLRVHEKERLQPGFFATDDELRSAVVGSSSTIAMTKEEILEAVLDSDDAGVVEPEIGVKLTKEFLASMSRKEKRAAQRSFLLVFPTSNIAELNLFEIKSRIELRTSRAVTHLFVKEIPDAAAVFVRIKKRNTNFFVDPSHFAIAAGGTTYPPRFFAWQGADPPAARVIPPAAITKDVTTIHDLDSGQARRSKRPRDDGPNPSTRP